MAAATAVAALLVLAYCALSSALERSDVPAPLAFVVAGGMLGLVGVGRTAQDVLWVLAVAEATLVLVLFHDAAVVPSTQSRAAGGPALRLLLVGYPLTVFVHVLTLRWIFPQQSVALSLFVAAVLAPTDAGLGARTLLDPAVPVRIRALLNVESGLNDGLATPLALFAIAVLAGGDTSRPLPTAVRALADLGIGAAVGTAVGAAGGAVLGWSRRRAASTRSARGLGLLVLPVLAYSGATLLSGNGFVAAFVSGLAVAALAHWVRDEDSVLQPTAGLSELLGFATWLVFGVVAVPLLWRSVGWRELAFALLSLTVLRMLPVALALTRSGLHPVTVLFVGWSGPRGLATVVFTLLAVETVPLDEVTRQALVSVTLTVSLSVVAHGMTAGPLAKRFGSWVREHRPALETAPAPEPRPRGIAIRRDGP